VSAAARYRRGIGDADEEAGSERVEKNNGCREGSEAGPDGSAEAGTAGNIRECRIEAAARDAGKVEGSTVMEVEGGTKKICGYNERPSISLNECSGSLPGGPLL